MSNDVSKVDPDLGTVQVTRAIEGSACGKIMNPKASHSQMGELRMVGIPAAIAREMVQRPVV